MDFAFIMLLLILLMCAVWLFISLAIYFIPVVIAYVRKHNNITAITILTIFLGWTFLGWLAAVFWALNSDVKEEYDS